MASALAVTLAAVVVVVATVLALELEATTAYVSTAIPAVVLLLTLAVFVPSRLAAAPVRIRRPRRSRAATRPARD